MDIHTEIVKAGYDDNPYIENALVDAYAKCGHLAEAYALFSKISKHDDVVLWTALIAGYAQKRQGVEALNCFTRMQREGHSPDAITFLSILNACCHAGKLREAQTYYENMSGKYGILPSLEHLTCMTVIYGYAGEFDKAISMVKTMAIIDDTSPWLSLLGTCRKLGNLKLGELAFEQVVQHGKSLGAAYVLMGNIYAAAGMQEDACMLESMKVRNAT